MLDELGATGFPKTSGGTGLHVYVRIQPGARLPRTYDGPRSRSRARWSARTDEVTTTWWRKDRDPTQLFVDYNQNARDHTIAAAYSVRGNPEAPSPRRSAGTRSTTSSRGDCTIATVPARFAELGDLHAGIDDAVFDIAPLLEWAERDEREDRAAGRHRRSG